MSLPRLILLLVLAASAVHDYALLNTARVAAGVDGYYYVLQLTELASRGRLYFSTPTPFVLGAITPFVYLLGNPITAIKIVSVLLHVLLCLGIWMILRSTLRNPWLAVLGSALAAIPQSHLYMTTEFINQLGAVVLLIWSGWSAIRALQTRRIIWMSIAPMLLIAAFLSHKSAVFFALTFLVCALLLRWALSGGPWGPVAMVAIAVFWFAPAIVSAQSFLVIPSWLNSQITYRPHWPFESPFMAEELMLALASSAVLFLITRPGVSVTTTSTCNSIFGSIALWSLTITLNPFLSSGALLSTAGRFRVLSYIQVALLLPALLWLAYAIRRQLPVYVGAVFLPLVVWSAAAPLPHGLRPEFLARREALAETLRVHQDEIRRNAMVVAPHGDQFLVTAATGVPSQQKPPDFDQGSSVSWLLASADQTLNRESIVVIGSENVSTIIAEDSVLRQRWQNMNGLERHLLLTSNPSLARSLSALTR